MRRLGVDLLCMILRSIYKYCTYDTKILLESVQEKNERKNANSESLMDTV